MPSESEAHLKNRRPFLNFYASRRYFSVGEFAGSFVGWSKYVKILFVFYIFVSLLYTLAQLYFLVSSVQPYNQRTTALLTSTSLKSARIQGKFQSTPHSMAPGSGSDVETDADLDPDAFLYQHISERMLFAKMFQYALQPTKIIPYFFRMTSNPPKDDITITTLITIERLQVLSNMVSRFKGPISVALHLYDDEKKVDAIELLHLMHRSNPLFAQYVDLHLIIDVFDRQFNLWRNVARFFARTDYIMTMDVDFLLCSDLRSNFYSLSPQYKKILENGNAVFVVPAFEFTKKAAELEIKDYPSTKEKLLQLTGANDATMFHNSWQRGHGSTNYPRWNNASEPYQVMEYNYNYEPYILMKKEGLPWCDERFVGYGSNKAACLYEIYLAGVEFWVLPEDFLIHQRHPYPENDRRVERKYNKRLYDSFREEICFKYMRMGLGVQNSKAIDERICGSNIPNYYGL